VFGFIPPSPEAYKQTGKWLRLKQKYFMEILDIVKVISEMLTLLDRSKIIQLSRERGPVTISHIA